MPLDQYRPRDVGVKRRSDPDRSLPGDYRFKMKNRIVRSKLPYDPFKEGYSDDDIIAGVTPYIDDNIRYFAKGLPAHIKDDLVSVGLDAANSAMENYDGSSRFTTYANLVIKGAITRAINYFKERGGPVASHKVLGASTDNFNVGIDAAKNIPSADDESKDRNTAKILSNIFNNAELSDNEKIVMMATYGINTNGEYSKKGPQSTQQIADTFGVSSARISQIRKKAVEKMQQHVQDNNVSLEEKNYIHLMADSNDMLIRINYKLIWG